MACDPTTVRLDLDKEPQPDALFRIDKAKGGQSRITEDDGWKQQVLALLQAGIASETHQQFVAPLRA